MARADGQVSHFRGTRARVTVMAVRVPRRSAFRQCSSDGIIPGVESGHLHGLGSRAQARSPLRSRSPSPSAPVTVLHQGFPVTDPDLRARDVWVTNGQELLAGRLNRQIEELDAAVATASNDRRVPGRRRRLPARRRASGRSSRSTRRSRRSPAHRRAARRASPTAATCSRSSRRRASSGPRPPAETSRSTRAAPIPSRSWRRRAIRRERSGYRVRDHRRRRRARPHRRGRRGARCQPAPEARRAPNGRGRRAGRGVRRGSQRRRGRPGRDVPASRAGLKLQQVECRARRGVSPERRSSWRCRSAAAMRWRSRATPPRPRRAADE